MISRDDFYKLGPSSNIFSTILRDGTAYPDVIGLEDVRPKEFIELISQTISKPLSECVIVDVGCGEGTSTLEFAKTGAKVIGIEGRRSVVNRASCLVTYEGFSNVEFRVADVLDDSAWESCDAVFCSGIIHHLQDPFKLMEKIATYCNGLAYFCTHNSPANSNLAKMSHFSEKLFDFDVFVANDKEYVGCFFDEGGSIKEDQGDTIRHPRAGIGNQHSYWPSKDGFVAKMHEMGFSHSKIIHEDNNRLRNRFVFSKSAHLDKLVLPSFSPIQNLTQEIASETALVDMNYLAESNRKVHLISVLPAFENKVVNFLSAEKRLKLEGVSFIDMKDDLTGLVINLVAKGVTDIIIDAGNLIDLQDMYKRCITPKGVNYIYCSFSMVNMNDYADLCDPVLGTKL